MHAARTVRSHHSLIRGIEHIGVVVPDISAAETFFADVFGSEVLYRSATSGGPDIAGADIGDVNGMPKDNSFKAVSMLRLGGGANIELFEVGHLTRDDAPAMTDLGVTHFSIYCDDVKVVGDAMLGAGGTMLEGPKPMEGQEAGDGNYIWFGRAPWGSLIELIQFPMPPICDAPEAKQNRWQPSSVSEVRS
jgi:catechol 2,3-dioxygenase-like lactoylglutathione lyase family enzyme